MSDVKATVLLAIPGSPTRYHPPPAGAIQAAIAGCQALSDRLLARRYWGSIEAPPVVAHWQGEQGRPSRLVVVIDTDQAWCHLGCTRRIIECGWGVVREWSDGREDLGWHPDAMFHGLTRAWRDLIRTALGPLQ